MRHAEIRSPNPSGKPVRALVLSWMLFGLGCAGDPPAATMLMDSTGPGGQSPAPMGVAPGVPTPSGGAQPAPSPAGAGAPMDTPNDGPAAPNVSPSGGQPSPGLMPGVDAGGMPADPGDGGVDGSSPLPVPEPASEPYVWGFGLGVTDVPAAVEFYTDVMEMSVEKEVVRGDRTDTILYAQGADRGARLVLMHFGDGRPTRQITAKLVWQSPNASGINRAASSYPDYVSRLSFGIVQFDGPETYIQEVGGVFDSGGAGIDAPYLVAMGFAVSDLADSRRFYTTAFGMEETPTGTFTVTDASGRGTITEYTLRHAEGAGIVVQGWNPERNAEDNPVMVVMFVPDAQAAADALVAAGGSIVEEAARTPVYDNRRLIVAKDPDGYLLELVE